MFDGIEIDMLSLGDADAILVSRWSRAGLSRVLIDGGRKADYPKLREFLRGLRITYLDAIVCTHGHEDHAAGLIELVNDCSITFGSAWMHQPRGHVDAATLQSAIRGNSAEAECAKQILLTTDELLRGIHSRGVTPADPFTNCRIADVLTVQGPSWGYYRKALTDAFKVPNPGSFAALLASRPPRALSPAPLSPLPAFLAKQRLPKPLLLPPRAPESIWAAALSGVAAGTLKNSAVQKNPSTQPYNNTSVILGATYGTSRMLFTSDAGADALRQVSLLWRNLVWLQVPHHGSDGNLSQDLIERFCPTIAYISACGDSSHPSRAIVSGLVKVGARVFSTHHPSPLHLRYFIGFVPDRWGYVDAVPLRGTGSPTPSFVPANLWRKA
jgi:beta-lactamase superfamily II metal-dependent hydrolase